MISSEWVYMVPETVEEAVDAWGAAYIAGKNPLYYAGGTEIISLCRDNRINPGVLIDIKKIKECTVLEEGITNTYGAALPLNQIVRHTKNALLKQILERIADHTIRNRLTLGGNVMGYLPYREAILPFLLQDGRIKIAGPRGIRTQLLTAIFDKRLKLDRGEFILSLSCESLPENWFFQRKEKDGRVDYPLLSICFSEGEGTIKMAVSGAFSFPIRSRESEKILNTPGLLAVVRSQQVAELMKDLFKSDFRASGLYRKHLFHQAIVAGINALED